MEFVAVDVETTGFDPKKDRIIEIAIVEFNGDTIIGDWSTLINPEVPFHGNGVSDIEPSHLTGKPTFADVAETVRDRLNGRTVVGHRVSFDIGFINAEMTKAGYPSVQPAKEVDTLKLARNLFPGSQQSLKLNDLAARLGIPNPEAHRAGPDADTAARCYLAMRQQLAKRPSGDWIVEDLKGGVWVRRPAQDIKPFEAEMARQIREYYAKMQ